jgi:hypothetical protein
MRAATVLAVVLALMSCACSTMRTGSTAKQAVVVPPAPSCTPPAELMKAPPGLLPLPRQEVAPNVAAELWYQDRLRYVSQAWDQAALQNWIRDNCQGSPATQTAKVVAPKPAGSTAPSTSAKPPRGTNQPAPSATKTKTPSTEVAAASPARGPVAKTQEPKTVPEVQKPGPSPVVAVKTSATSSLHVFSCDNTHVAGKKAASAPIAGPKALANTVAIDKGLVHALWQDGGEAAVRQLGETLCQRQNPPRRAQMEPIVGPDDLKTDD